MGRGEQERATPAPPRREKPWVCPAFELEAATLDRIEAWRERIGWPEGTELTKRSGLHVTAFYAREGLGDEGFQRWVAQLRPPAFAARVAALEYFDPGDRDTLMPLVLKLEAPELKAWAERITAEAERRFGIAPLRHPDGYNPHVTIAKVPDRIELPAPPSFTLHTGGIFELHARKLGRLLGRGD